MFDLVPNLEQQFQVLPYRLRDWDFIIAEAFAKLPVSLAPVLEQLDGSVLLVTVVDAITFDQAWQRYVQPIIAVVMNISARKWMPAALKVWTVAIIASLDFTSSSSPRKLRPLSPSMSGQELKNSLSCSAVAALTAFCFVSDLISEMTR
jgi:hypothetical protein